MDEEKKKVVIRIPEDARPNFSNVAQVNVSDDSVVMQFAFVRPNTTQGQLVAEVVLSPKHAIEFNRALDSTIKKHFTRHLGEAQGS
ncbi:DUF3467 domain-containing protein [Patescibacteria group bacterium]|nr:DUF3467 domain-containing protein [Patescibacteria group bacterium]